MPTLRVISRRLISTALLLSSAVAIVGALSVNNPANAETTCAAGAQVRTLDWSNDQNPDNGAVWSEASNTYDLGDDLYATASLIDAGGLDAPSTLANSGLLAQASPGQAGTLVWNLDTISTDQPASSTLLFEFSKPVESFSVVVIDIDAKSAESSNIGWHDKVTGVVEGEGTSLGLLAADPSVVTVEGSSAWAAPGTAKTTNESPAGNVTISATGSIFSAGITYSDGPRSTGLPERHAIGVSSINVCLSQSGEAPTTTTASSNLQEEADDSISDAAPTTSSGLEAPVLAETIPGELSAASKSDLAITTEASEPVSNGLTSYSFVYSVSAANYGATTINSVQMFYDLKGPLAAAKSWKVNDVQTSYGDCVASDTYDGITQDELLSPEVDLAAGARCTVQVSLSLEPGGSPQEFVSSAKGSGLGPENKLITSAAEALKVTVSSEDQSLAYTGTEAEDLAAIGALLFILGAISIGYRDRFLLGVRVVSGSD